MLSLEYFTGGHAIFTIQSKTGEYYTYKISHSHFNGQDFHFVHLLTGPSNEMDYTYLGMIKGENIILTKKSRLTKDSIPYRVISWAWQLINQNKNLPDGYSIRHNGQCGRCGRTLTTPESIERGIGPICAQQ